MKFLKESGLQILLILAVVLIAGYCTVRWPVFSNGKAYLQDSAHCIRSGHASMYCKRELHGKSFCYYQARTDAMTGISCEVFDNALKSKRGKK
jgi:hypothetical protein